jgi:hypothetical protein
MNDKRDKFMGLHLNYREMKVIKEYAARVHLRPSTALKQAFFAHLENDADNKDLLIELMP